MHSIEIVSQSQCYENMNCVNGGSRDGTKVRALASNQYVPGSIPGPGIMWIYLLCSERFFFGYSGFHEATADPQRTAAQVPLSPRL